jgi:acetyl-CoA carboxylase carboxyltransferase component
MPQFGTTISPNAYDKNTQLMARWPEIIRQEKAEKQEQENIAKIQEEKAFAKKNISLLLENNSRIQAAFLKG